MHLDSQKKPKYDVRLYNHMPQGGLHSGIVNRGFFALIGTVLFLCPFLLHTMGRQLIKNLQQSRSKAKVPFFWAVASLAHVLNIYIIFKIQITTCYPYRAADLNIRNCIVSNVLLLYILVTSSIIVYVHSKYVTFPIPKTWNILMKCCGRKQHKIIMTISLWGIYLSAAGLLECLPYQALMVSANPHLYGFGILTVWCSMFVCIILTSIPFTIDQIFINEAEYKITPKHAFRHIMVLLFIAVLVFGFGSLTFSITLVLHLSKYGEKTQSVSKSVYFVLRYTVLPIAAWMIQVLYHKVKVKIHRTFQH